MERFDTSVKHHAWYEHWHRYYFVKELVKDKLVCDLACGEGYGSALLATEAKSVVGVDLDVQTVKLAQQKYSRFSNLTYVQSNALETTLKDNQFDVVVSFETLEHLKEHDQLLKEYLRILKDDGLLIISTPDKEVYSSHENHHNEFHLKELTSVEFDCLTSKYFKYSQMFGQKLQLMSVIENQIDAGNQLNQNIYVEQGCEFKLDKNTKNPVYLLKICTNNKSILDQLTLPYSHSFSDIENSLYQHYESQIKKLMLMDKDNIKLKDTVEKQQAIINHLKSRLGY